MKGRPWGEDRFSDGTTILQKSHHSLLTMARPVEEEERRASMGQFGHRAVLLGKHPAAMQHCGTIVSSEGPLPSLDILVALSENLDDEYLQPAAEVISCDFISKLDIALSLV